MNQLSIIVLNHYSPQALFFSSITILNHCVQYCETFVMVFQLFLALYWFWNAFAQRKDPISMSISKHIQVYAIKSQDPAPNPIPRQSIHCYLLKTSIAAVVKATDCGASSSPRTNSTSYHFISQLPKKHNLKRLTWAHFASINPSSAKSESSSSEVLIR